VIPRGDFILEVICIEAVESAFGRFRLRIHEETDWRAVRRWQRDIVREVALEYKMRQFMRMVFRSAVTISTVAAIAWSSERGGV
jgi:hypothetical protein